MANDYYGMLALFDVEQRKFVEAFRKRSAATGASKPTAIELDLWKATYNQISMLKQALESFIKEKNADDSTCVPASKL